MDLSLVAYAISVVAEFFLWFMLGRVALALLSRGKSTFFTQLFDRITFPAFWVVRKITPGSVHDGHIPILSLPLLFALMIALRQQRA